MSIERVLAVVPVRDVHRSRRWYETLIGRAADNNLMANLVEWQVDPGGWVQVFADDQHAGSTVVNFAVQDLDNHIDELKQRDLEPGDVVEANKGGRLSALTDPEGTRSGSLAAFESNTDGVALAALDFAAGATLGDENCCGKRVLH